jgi:hypothetical protein
VVESKSSPAELAQKFLGESWQAARDAKKNYEWQAKWRLYLARGLKGVAVFAGLIVAGNKYINVPTEVLGLLISAVVLVDGLLANHRRLVLFTSAGNAVNRAIRRVEHEHNSQLVEVARLRDAGQTSEAADLLTKSCQAATNKIREEIDKVATGVEDANVELLNSLNVEQQNRSSAT